MTDGETPNPDDRSSSGDSNRSVKRVMSRGAVVGVDSDSQSPNDQAIHKTRWADSTNATGELIGGYRVKRVSTRGAHATSESSPFDNVKIGYKLLILVMLLATPTVALLFLLIQEKNIAIEFSTKEQYGVDYTRPTVRLLETSALHGWAGLTTSTEDLKSVQRPHITNLDSVNQRLGSIMKVDTELLTLKNQLLQNARSTTSSTDNYRVEATQIFIARINDASNLILDPDLDSYYVMDASMLIFPEQYPRLIGIARELVTLAPEPGQDQQDVVLEADTKASLTARIGIVREALRRHKRGFEVARDNNPSGVLGEETYFLSNTMLDQVEHFLSACEEVLRAGKLVQEDRSRLLGLAITAVESVSTIWHHSFDKLDQLLTLRIQGFQNRKVQALTGVGLGILLAGLLAFAIGRRLNTRVGKLTNIAHRIADNAEIDLEVDNDLEALASKDEVGDLATTLAVMTLKLRRSIDEIRSKSLELEDANATLEGRVARRTAEIQAKNEQLASTLEQLERTKDQLIVQEKMASLGNLTAGIAHEIKNPLNFVNNFAELSVEIASEVREILDGVREKLPANVIEDLEMCLDDLQQNVAKISEHGKRADSIVKGMLQHSRGASGEFVTTNVNALLEEYVNLAYHGMRAQDSTFNVTIEKELDRSLPDIPVVPQDLSRVFLNIVNNGCYAAFSKKQSGKVPDTFMPTISVGTKRVDDRMEIRIRDNGTGMPESVRAKIFEPFFTTKPTGVGTGLGLSLSYDIVVQEHGGTLDVSTVDGEGTEFIITLPMAKEKKSA